MLAKRTVAVLVLVAGAAFPLTGCQQPPSSGQPDASALVIRGGRILDGTGNPWFRGDVLVVGDRIRRVGVIPAAAVPPGARELDASGLLVMPGFIDPHSHAGPGLATPELRAGIPVIHQGITTVMVNPDGGGPADLAEQRRPPRGGRNRSPRGPHDRPRAPCVAEVLGMEDRPPSEEELERMAGLVRAGLEAGAFGMTGGLYYAPGSYAENSEVVRLAAEITPWGAFVSHNPGRERLQHRAGRRGGGGRGSGGDAADPRGGHPLQGPSGRRSGG